jgi:hypothetical protein
MNEVADVLRRVVRGETTAMTIGRPYQPGEVTIACFLADGFEIRIHDDAGCLDYVEGVKAPDGRTCKFEEWADFAHTQAELEIKRPDREILDPLGLLSEEEVVALEKALVAAALK